jgi:hypothetical protein
LSHRGKLAVRPDPTHENHVDAEPDEFSRDVRESVEATRGVTPFDLEILTLNPRQLAELPEEVVQGPRG